MAPPSLRRMQQRHGLLVALVAGTTAAAGMPGSGSMLLGGIAIGLSTQLNAMGMRALIGKTGPRLAIGILSVKLLLLLGLGWLAFSSELRRPHPVGFALGVSCFPISALLEAFGARESR